MHTEQERERVDFVCVGNKLFPKQREIKAYAKNLWEGEKQEPNVIRLKLANITKQATKVANNNKVSY